MTPIKENTFFDFVNVIGVRVNSLSTLMKVVLNFRLLGSLAMHPAVSACTAKSPGRNVLVRLYWLRECQMANSLQHSCGKAPAIPASST